MANEAHKEPTMEEILSSIRKIISEDDAQVVTEDEDDTETLTVEDVVAEDADNDDFEELSIDDMVETAKAEADAIVDESIFDDEDGDEIDLTAAEAALPKTENIEDELDAILNEDVADELVESVVEDLDKIITTDMEADMAATAKYESTILTEESTADAAAGSLGKLISTMDFGGENTIEGLVRELLRPMIKDWLDGNLPGIVESKVEAEVQRIARMAR